MFNKNKLISIFFLSLFLICPFSLQASRKNYVEANQKRNFNKSINLKELKILLKLAIKSQNVDKKWINARMSDLKQNKESGAWRIMGGYKEEKLYFFINNLKNKFLVKKTPGWPIKF